MSIRMAVVDTVTQNFTEYVSNYISSDKFRKHDVFPGKDRYNEFIQVLLGKSTKPSEYKRKIRKKFTLVRIGKINFVMSKVDGKRILCWEDLESVLLLFHNQKGHGGRDTTVKKLQDVYHYVPFRLVNDYIKMCDECSARRPVIHPPSQYIVSAHFNPKTRDSLNNIQVDWIDMQSYTDGEFKWIIRAQCLHSKFIWGKALPTQDSQNVIDFLRYVFYTFGPAKIVKISRLGWNFDENQLKSMLEKEFPTLRVIYTGELSVQGADGVPELVYYGTLEARIAAHIIEKGSFWSQAVNMLVYEVNTNNDVSRKSTAFEIMFSRKANVESSADIEEEELDELSTVVMKQPEEDCTTESKIILPAQSEVIFELVERLREIASMPSSSTTSTPIDIFGNHFILE